MKKNCPPGYSKKESKKHEMSESRSKERSEDKKFIKRAKGGK